MSIQHLRTTLVIAAIGALLIAVVPAAQADHSWGDYHWERASNPFTLELGDNVDGVWDQHLMDASDDWSASSVLDTTVVPGNTKPRQCRAANGHVEVCNDTYGNTGWLGVAGISVKGGHIQSGYVKVNDTYFDDPNRDYDQPVWRQLVMCQEIGHIFGLGHQDEDFSNDPIGTCMDYHDDPVSGVDDVPDQHDFDQLADIYSHLDGAKDDDGGGGNNGKGPPWSRGSSNGDASAWGREVASDGHSSTFVRQDGDTMLVTHVIWAH